MSATTQTIKPKIDRDQILEAMIPILAVITALLAGAVIILISQFISANLATGFKGVSSATTKTPWQTLVSAYVGLFQGAFGSPRAISETLIATTPYILTGLAVAVGFRGGLFNIGAEGQYYVGSICAVFVGYTFKGLPPFLHIILSMLAGIVGGGLFAAIPGYLKARFGIHEVINTIMLNYIGVKTIDWLVRGPLRDPKASLDQTYYILDSAKLPKLLPWTDLRVHIGIIIALLMVFVINWLLFKTTLGYELRTVGSNPSVARYAGMSVARNFVVTMVISGGLAGMAGAVQQLGMNYTLKAVFATGYGFDSIAVALLAKSNPFGIIPAALLWGALRNGAALMQVRSNMSIDLINIVQALVIMFVAADQMIRWLYHIKTTRGTRVVFTRGWGGG
jgi:simple sugar transport system permease protein